MDFLARNYLNNYTTNIITKKELENFLFDIKNKIQKIEENTKDLNNKLDDMNKTLQTTRFILCISIIYNIFF